MNKERLIPTSEKAVRSYETTINVFESMFREIKDMSKKKPETVVSEFKVNHVNRLLADIKAFLSKEPEGKYLDLLDAEALPQVADVVLVMAQYEGSLKAFKDRHYGFYEMERQWVIE